MYLHIICSTFHHLVAYKTSSYQVLIYVYVTIFITHFVLRTCRKVFPVFAAVASAIIILLRNQMDSILTFVPFIVVASYQTGLLVVHPSCHLHTAAATSMFHIILAFLPFHSKLNYTDQLPPLMSTNNTATTSSTVTASTQHIVIVGFMACRIRTLDLV